MSGEKLISLSAEGDVKEQTPAAARSLLESSGRDFSTVAAAEAATYAEPEHCYIKETSLLYQHDSASTATRNVPYVLNTGGTGRLVALNGAWYDPVADKIYFSGVLAYDFEDLVFAPGSSGSFRVNDPGGTGLRVGGGEQATTLIRVDDGDGTSGNSNYGFSLVYHGDRTGNNNSFSIYADNQQGTEVEAFTILQDGFVGFNQSSPTALHHATGPTSDSSAHISKEENSSGVIVASTRCDGLRTHTGGIARPPLTITADVTLTTATQAFLLIDFAATGGVVTFPASPEHGQEFHPENKGSFTITLARNGKLINGNASNVTLNSQSAEFFKYDAPTGSWWNFK